jgi:ABC-type multidrug transport system ATPase subunit
LTVNELIVLNQPDERLIPRRYSIDGLSFTVEKGETLLVVGSRAAGKDTLSEALLKHEKPSGVKIAPGYQVILPPEPPYRDDQFSQDKVIVKNGFHTRDQAREDLPLELRDPPAPQHWELLHHVKKAGSTFIALAEIDKLDNEKTSEFSRIIVLDLGRIVADDSIPEFKNALETWINDYATERLRSLKQDGCMLIKKFGLTVRNDYNWKNNDH